MTLRDTTRSIISLVEQTTDRPVIVRADSSLKTLATVTIARRGAPAHVVTYNPSASSPPDYLICFQAGFLLRLFANPPSERFDFAESAEGRRHVIAAVASQPELRKQGLAAAVLQQYGDSLFDGLMTQLRSVPIGLRVDTWIAADLPDLADLQKVYVIRQLQDNQQVLAPAVRRLASSPIYESSVAMNAAFAAYWARAWTQPSFEVPYTVTGASATGQELLRLWDMADADPRHDRSLVDAWASHLGLTGWYQWVPYTP